MSRLKQYEVCFNLRLNMPRSFESRNQAVFLELDEELPAEPRIIGGVLNLAFIKGLGPVGSLDLLGFLHL